MADKKNNTSVIVLGVGIVAALVLLISQGPDVSFWKNMFRSDTDDAEIAFMDELEEQDMIEEPEDEYSGPTKKLGTIKSEAAQKARTLNEQGVSLIQKKKNWQGLYRLHEAIVLDPANIIPIINMAVVLSDMGLDRPASRYIAMAKAIDPKHPYLLKNFELASYSLDDSMIFAGVSSQKGLSKPQIRNEDFGGTLPLNNDDILMLWGVDVLNPDSVELQ